MVTLKLAKFNIFVHFIEKMGISNCLCANYSSFIPLHTPVSIFHLSTMCLVRKTPVDYCDGQNNVHHPPTTRCP